MEKNIVPFLFLLWGSYEDIKEKKISIVLLGTFFIVSILKLIFKWDILGVEQILGIIPGLVFVGLSFITNEAVGYGDSILLCILGIYVGIQDCISILSIAFLFAFIWSLFLVLVKKKNKKDNFAFVPFLFLGCLGGFL